MVMACCRLGAGDVRPRSRDFHMTKKEVHFRDASRQILCCLRHGLWLSSAHLIQRPMLRSFDFLETHCMRRSIIKAMIADSAILKTSERKQLQAPTISPVLPPVPTKPKSKILALLDAEDPGLWLSSSVSTAAPSPSSLKNATPHPPNAGSTLCVLTLSCRSGSTIWCQLWAAL